MTARAEEEPATVDVVLTGSGDKKIGVIKVVRAATGLGLKEAKALVDEAPKPVKEGIEREEAETAQGDRGGRRHRRDQVSRRRVARTLRPVHCIPLGIGVRSCTAPPGVLATLDQRVAVRYYARFARR